MLPENQFGYNLSKEPVRRKIFPSALRNKNEGELPDMLISIVADGRGNGAIVSERYEEGKYLLIYESDTRKIVKVYPANPADPLFFAKKTVSHLCEAIVTGVMQEPEFELVASEGITRYNGSGLNALIALCAAVDNVLPLFVTFEGGTRCDEYEHTECSCEENGLHDRKEHHD